MRKASPSLPAPVLESLAAFGAGLRNLRLRRGVPTTYAAQSLRISRWTLHKIERGDPGVAIGSYARVLDRYGVLNRLERVADLHWNRDERERERIRLPQRIRSSPMG